MEDQTNQQGAHPEQSEQKPERIDELDVIGALLLRVIQKGLNGIKHIFSPGKVQ